MTIDFKFAFVSGCLIVALFSYSRCVSKRDWGFLAGGLGFTVLADYFLVMRDDHLLGIAAFCFTHICYILRATGIKKRTVSALYAFGFIWGLAIIFESVVALSAIYAFLFAVSIFVNIKARRDKWNYFLITTGLILFALCDINVMLFNLPRYFGAANAFYNAFILIWVFYLPSQALLAISAIRINGAAVKEV